MTTRMNLISPRPRKDGKTFWCTIGAAFPRDNGGWSLVFDALPLPDAEGRVTVLMVDAEKREERREEPRQRGGAPAGGRGGYDDGGDIPFMPEWR